MSSTKSKTASEAAITIEHGADAAQKGFDKTLVAMKDGMERAAKGFETSQVKIKEQVEKAMKTTEEVLAFSQGNMEALVKASQIYAAGCQDLSKTFATSSKNSLEETVAFTKSLMGAKSVKEAVDLHTGFAKASIEKAVSEANKMTDASVKLTEQVIAPLTARFTLAVETFGKAR
ncbi:MAG TPA: TIGR01841 family phasin [Acidocella sp.]|jgi:phasin family protein|uniref:phasin family protein n=1 Tax=Acidocella sp. TaxID=50710 RepID=UPI002C32DDB4|nr:TIGR01841 family phasin [Acidocella sp.]HVE21874.1 TIGR01841 family phasin [Acidocella sp.]